MADVTARAAPARSRGAAYRPFRIRARVFTPAQCRRIVDLGTGLSGERGALVDGGGAAGAPAGIRDSAAAWLARSPDTEWVFDRIEGVVEWANRSYGFELDGLVEDLQFTTYDRPGSHYTWHQDGLDASVADRKLAVVVQLSDPDSYLGADLEFLEVAEDYGRTERTEYLRRSRALGAAIVFPSFEFHRVLPLRRGVRRSLVAWVAGPPFR